MSYRFLLRGRAWCVVLTDQLRAECPVCGEVKPLPAFGMRHMGNGEVRMQPMCGPCRGLTPRERYRLRRMVCDEHGRSPVLLP